MNHLVSVFSTFLCFQFVHPTSAWRCCRRMPPIWYLIYDFCWACEMLFFVIPSHMVFAVGFLLGLWDAVRHLYKGLPPQVVCALMLLGTFWIAHVYSAAEVVHETLSLIVVTLFLLYICSFRLRTSPSFLLVSLVGTWVVTQATINPNQGGCWR